MIAGILTIGDEILIGQTIDTNSATIGKELNKIGIKIKKILSVADEKNEIIKGFSALEDSCDVILVTGGLGPTKDDITKHAFAEYFDDELVFNEEHFEIARQKFESRGFKVREAHRVQFQLPSKAKLYENDMGSAPGMLFRKNGTKFFSMPGVPHEMKHLLTDRLMPILQAENDVEVYHRTLLTVGVGETALAEKIEPITNRLPSRASVAFLPSLGAVKIRFSISGTDISNEKEEVNSLFDEMKEILSDHVYGEGDTTLSSHVGDLLKAKGLKLSVAESCTGGLLGNTLVKTPGSSAYFEGGVLSYSYEQKVKLLGVKQSTLDSVGAVSEQTVKEMQKGVINVTHSDVSISISGIAGPGGGTPEKPVGTIWMACGNSDKCITRKILAGKNREKNMEYGVVQALNLLRQFINEVY